MPSVSVHLPYYVEVEIFADFIGPQKFCLMNLEQGMAGSSTLKKFINFDVIDDYLNPKTLSNTV